MREIIQQWCDTNQLSLQDAMTILSEYFILDNRTATPEQLQTLITLGQSFMPIDWEFIIMQICLKNNWTLLKVESAPNNIRQRMLLKRYLYDS